MSLRRMLLVTLVVLGAACVQKKGAQPTGQAQAPAAAPDTTASASEVLFGEVGSLTGQEATFGVSTHQGIQLALDEINAGGGLDVGGRKLKVRVITYDDQGKTTEAAAATTKLVIQDKVNVILGEVASSKSKAMAAIAETNHVPMVTPSSTNPEVTKGKQFVFRVCFIDPFQGWVMAKFAHDDLKMQKVAVLRDVGNDYSMGLADYFKQDFTKMGGQIVGDASYQAGDINFKAQLTQLRGQSPQAIYVPGYYTDVGLIARQARELGITTPLLGGDGWDSAKLYEIGGKALDGSYFSNHYAPELPDPRVQQFVAGYQKTYGHVPDGLAALGYDAARIAADAIHRAGSLDGARVKDALAQTHSFPGVTGSITINGDHDTVKPAMVLEIQNGAGHYKTTIAPGT